MRILNIVDIQDFIGDLKYELEVEEITLGMQWAQHHDVGKAG